jgi:hypothetical protein
VISTPGAKFMTGDLKDFYLGTPLPEYKYMRIPVKLIPESIMIHYDLAKLVHNDFVIVEIRRGMYGCHRPAVSPTSNSSSSSNHTAMPLASSLADYGNTTPGKIISPWS